MNATTGKPAGNSHDRESLLAGLADLEAMIRALGDDDPVPVVSANWAVPLGPREDRVSYLEGIGRLLGVEAGDDLGDRRAERWFGPVRGYAVLRNPDPSVSALKARVAARRASVSVTGSGATA